MELLSARVLWRLIIFAESFYNFIKSFYNSLRSKIEHLQCFSFTEKKI